MIYQKKEPNFYLCVFIVILLVSAMSFTAGCFLTTMKTTPEDDFKDAVKLEQDIALDNENKNYDTYETSKKNGIMEKEYSTALIDEPMLQENKDTVSFKGNYITPDSRLIVALQGVGFQDLYNSDFDIAKIDCDDSKLSPGQISRLQAQGKKIISYLSIGEAEAYRDYWLDDWQTGNPEFIDDENPDWVKNYKVRYWHKEWQDIIFRKLEQIQNTGYDGVYLDMVDAYLYYQNKGYNHTDKEMVDFILNISGKAKTINQDFLIIPQNADPLIKNFNYLCSIDGIGVENLWYKGDSRVKNEITDSRLNNLKIAKSSNKFVIAISYVKSASGIKTFSDLCKKYGFIPFIGDIKLGSIENKAN